MSNDVRTVAAQMPEADRRLLETVFADPVVWGETVLLNRDGAPRRYWAHQVGDLRCTARNIIHLDGRDVGKTIVLSTDALYFATTTAGVSGLVAAPHQGHLDTIIEEIEYQLDTSPLLRTHLAVNAFGKPKILRKPYYRVEFKNGSVLYFRPAGNYGEAFRSLHVERVWVDEGAWLTESAWKALRQCLKAGGRMRIYSTPNGIRTSTYYRLTFSEQFTQFRWPSWLNPYWTGERECELLEFYGGRDTAGWQHEVAGEHGKPSYGAFNQEHFDAACQEILEYRTVRITGADLSGCAENAQLFDLLEAMLDLTPQAGVFWIGADLGYTNDPTEVVIFQEASGEKPVASLVLRIHCEHVAYPILSMLIALLERYFTPAGIGIDNGGNGGSVVQELLTLDAYRPLSLSGRLRGVDFGGVTVLPTPDGGEVRKRTKELMTSLINGMLQRREIRFPHGDLELQDQFTTHTYTMTNNAVVYSKGHDHIIDAVRCAVLVRELGRLNLGETQSVCITPLVTAPIFF
ncbi:MAG: phage terminase large subunit family protein [Armatimonadota bacterium]